MIKKTSVSRNRAFLPEDACILHVELDEFNMVHIFYEEDQSKVREYGVKLLRVGDEKPSNYECVEVGHLHCGEMVFVYLETFLDNNHD